MLASLRSLWELAPTPVIAPLMPAYGGTWTCYQLGEARVAESLNGKMKVKNPQRIIEAARSAGASIKWLD